MTTALDYIKRSLRLLGVYAKGEEPSPDESQDGLAVLNGLMGALSNTPLVYAKTLDTIPLAAGVGSITVGPSGTTVTTRPVEVLDATYVSTGFADYPLTPLTEEQYSAIPVKTTQGIPDGIRARMNMPDIELAFYPVPLAGLTLKLWSIKQLQTFPSLTTQASLPPGYDFFVPYFLAEALSAEYDRPVPPEVKAQANRGRLSLGLANLDVPMLQTAAQVTPSGHFNVLTNR